MCARQDLEGVECDLDKPRIAPNTLGKLITIQYIGAI